MEEFAHPSDDLNDPLLPEPQALLDRFKAYAVWHPRLLQIRKQVLNTPTSASNGHIPRRALFMNTRPPDGELFHRTNFYPQGLTLLGKTTFDRHIQVDVATAEHLVEKKRPRGKVPAYQDNPEVRDAYETELRRLALRTVILDEAQHLI